MSQYFTSNFMQKLKHDKWSTITLALRDGFDDTGNIKECDYNFSIYFGIRHLLIHKQSKIMNSNTFSFAVKDISDGLIKALKYNNKDLFIGIKYCLPIAQHYDIESVIYTMQYTQRYTIIFDLFTEMIKAMKICNHWLHHSLTVHGMTYFIVNQIQKAYNIYIGVGKLIKPHSIITRLLNIWKLTNKILIFYLNKIMNYKKNIIVMRNLSKIQGGLASKCGNTKCTKYYFEWKYEQKQSNILLLVLAGEKIKTINKWFICKRCLIQFYCCRKCQKYHWKHQHFKYCKNYIN